MTQQQSERQKRALVRRERDVDIYRDARDLTTNDKLRDYYSRKLKKADDECASLRYKLGIWVRS